MQATGVQAGSLLALNFYPCDAGATACSNNNGNIWREVITSSQMSGAVTQEYRYDPTNRLAVAVEKSTASVTPTSTCAAVGGSWCQTFGYDGYGNRWVNTYSATPPVDTPTSASNFDASNHLTVNQATPDAGGNLYQIGGSNGTRYTYDAENRLTAVTNLLTSTTIASYAYDGDGRRVQKTSGTTTTYVYDAQGELSAEYVSGTVSTPPCSPRYLTADHLGSTRLMTDSHGTAVALHDYQPFGEEIPSGVVGRSSLYGQTDNPTQKFTGKERNSELANSADPSGFDYFGARYFSAAQGMFTTPDWSSMPQPIPYADLTDPQTMNLYAYVRNNPISRVDLDGHIDCSGKNAYGIGCQFLAYINGGPPGETLTDKVTTKAKSTLNAVGHGLEKTSDFLNTAPGIGLVLGMAVLLESGGERETPAVAEAEEGFEAAASKGAQLASKAAEVVRDATGKIHLKNLPKFVPDSWSKEDLEEVAHELRQSIEVRVQELMRLGEHGGHRARIEEERDLLRKVDKKLTGS